MVVPETHLPKLASDAGMTTCTPVAVGGVGGSGTSVVAAILKEAEFSIGVDLNASLDNLWFTLLFKHRGILEMPDDHFSHLVAIFVASMSGDCLTTPPDLAVVDDLATCGRIQHNSQWLRARAQSLRHTLAAPVASTRWGWKEPNTHMVVDRLAAEIPRMKYIHVVRNGLDIAYSTNQNQLQFWGSAVLGTDNAITPRNSLRFWCWAHSRIVSLGEQMKPRFLFVRLEDLCSKPDHEVQKILSFAGVKVDTELLNRAMQLVVSPRSIGRHRSYSLDIFDPQDVAFVESLGFNI